MTQRERQPVPETPQQTVERFIGFTKKLFSDNHDLDVHWEDEMNKLYGNEELLRITKDSAYKGVGAARINLENAFKRGGLPSLKATYMLLALRHTKVGGFDTPVVVSAFEKIIDFS